MKPLYLITEGLPGKDNQRFDFTTQVAGLAAICNQDISELKDLMALGFYGDGEKGKIEFSYEYNGEEYIIKRNFDSNIQSLSCREGDLVCEGEEVNEVINTHLKLSRKAFDKLVVIDRDTIYDSFMSSSQQREHFVGSLLDEFVFDKAEISLIEQKIKEKYDKTLMQIELTEEVTPQELADLKKEITDKTLIRQDIRNEMNALYDNIHKGEEAAKNSKKLAEEKEALEKAQEKSSVIKEMTKMLETSSQAEVINALIERKQNIIESDKILQERKSQLDELIEKENITIQKGQKSVKKHEQILIHCLARLKELREILYNRIKSLTNDTEYQQSIKEQIKELYQKEDEELVILNQNKQQLVNELSALKMAYNEIVERIKEIDKSADLKKAIREGAVLETEIKKLIEIISYTKTSVQARENKLTALKAETQKKEEELNRNKYRLDDLDRFIKANFKTREEALNNAENALLELHDFNIKISLQEQEIEAIEAKIQENIVGKKEYHEDIEVLNGAKESLFDYIQKQYKSIEQTENKLFDMKVNYAQIKQITELEYGQECPLCNSVILNKKHKDYKIEDLSKKIQITEQELKKAKDILKEYDQKMQLINTRTGELSARIKISEAYIQSLNEHKQSKRDIINAILQKAGVNNSFELSRLLNEAIQKTNKLRKANEDYILLAKEIEKSSEYINNLKAESIKLENEEIPMLLERYQKAADRLSQLQSEYSGVSEFLGGTTATEKLEELAIAEKEYQTLISDITEKKAKIDQLRQEKEKTEQLILILEGRRNDITIKDKSYDYQSAIIKVITDNIGELLEEIAKSEEEAEQVKTELAAVKKVLNDIEQRNKANIDKVKQIEIRLESDKEVLEQIMSDYEGELTALRVNNTKELRKLILSPEKREDIRQEIAAYNGAIVLHSNNVERLQKAVEQNMEFLEQLEENKQTIKALNENYEELAMKIANTTARRAEMKSSAKQLFALKEKLVKYEEKLKVLGEIVEVINEKGDITKYIVKLASKRLYSLSKGKYNLDVSDGELVLLNNSEGGKKINRKDYTKEEKLLVSLVLGTSLHRTLIDMIGGEPFMLIFPLKEKEAGKDIVAALTGYARKKSLMVVANNKTILTELEKLN